MSCGRFLGATPQAQGQKDRERMVMAAVYVVEYALEMERKESIQEASLGHRCLKQQPTRRIVISVSSGERHAANSRNTGPHMGQ